MTSIMGHARPHLHPLLPRTCLVDSLRHQPITRWLSRRPHKVLVKLVKPQHRCLQVCVCVYLGSCARTCMCVCACAHACVSTCRSAQLRAYVATSPSLCVFRCRRRLRISRCCCARCPCTHDATGVVQGLCSKNTCRYQVLRQVFA